LALDALPLDPEERVPEPERCDGCMRPTFLPEGWDDFGGTSSPGTCLACGYQRSADDAYDKAVTREMRRMMDRDD
jgi:hypothetical protein